MRNLVLIGSAVLPVLLTSAAFAQSTSSLVCECAPVDGQPAADVLASEDVWGNPTFIGGITNGGPDSGSVW